jgi:hypothetical protein
MRQTAHSAKQIYGADVWIGSFVHGTYHAETVAGRFAGMTNWCPSM